MVSERVGFEPTCPFGQDAFEAPPLRPLRYLSITYFARGAPPPLASRSVLRSAGVPSGPRLRPQALTYFARGAPPPLAARSGRRSAAVPSGPRLRPQALTYFARRTLR